MKPDSHFIPHYGKLMRIKLGSIPNWGNIMITTNKREAKQPVDRTSVASEGHMTYLS